MPGKADFGAGGTIGQYAPGSKEYRAWDEGWRYRYSDTALNAPIGDNPHDPTDSPAKYQAWNDGWNEADANSGGAQRMPATTGTAPV